MSRHKPQPAYARLTQPPRSASHGQNRRTPSTNHSDPLDGADQGAGGADAKSANYITWTTIHDPQSFLPGGITYLPPGASLTNYATLMQKAMDDIIKTTMIHSTGIDFAKPPIPYTGIHSGELTGHRAWFVTNNNKLSSLAHHYIWEPGATIEGDTNKVVWSSWATGQERYGGVYAYRDFETLRDDVLNEAAKDKQVFPHKKHINHDKFQTDYTFFGNAVAEFVTYIGLAYGTVKLWGETVEHEKGYRASFAKLTSIDGFIGISGFDLPALRRRYRV